MNNVFYIFDEKYINNMITTISLIKYSMTELFTEINNISSTLELSNPIRDISEIIGYPINLQRILSEPNRITFYKKYLKYKEKYLKLKQSIN